MDQSIPIFGFAAYSTVFATNECSKIAHAASSGLLKSHRGQSTVKKLVVGTSWVLKGSKALR
jgi:hypothetical protein